MTLSRFLRLLWRQQFLLAALGLGFRVILQNPCLITSDDSTKQVWFKLKTVENVLIHLHTTSLLINIQKFWHHFCVNFSHTYVVADHLPNTVVFHVQLTCDHSNSQLITTYQLPSPYDVDLCPDCWRPPTLWIIFSFHFVFFCATQKPYARHSIISIHLLKHFKWLCLSLPEADQTFFFAAYCSSVLIAERPGKEIQANACQKCNGCREIILQLYTPKISC